MVAEQETEFATQMQTAIDEYQWTENAKDTKYFLKHLQEEEKEGMTIDEYLALVETSYKQLKVLATRVTDEQGIAALDDLRAYRVLKYPLII